MPDYPHASRIRPLHLLRLRTPQLSLPLLLQITGGPPLITVIVIIAVAYLFFHAGHSHANYRHGRAHGRRGINLYWSSIRGPWISVPGPFGTRIGHRL